MKPRRENKRITNADRRRQRNRLVSILTAAVVFFTTYAMVLPAITMEEEVAAQEPGIVLEQPAAEVPVEPAAPEPVAAEPLVAEPVAEPAAVEAAPAETVVQEEVVPAVSPEEIEVVTPEPAAVEDANTVQEDPAAEPAVEENSNADEEAAIEDPASEEEAEEAEEETEEEEEENKLAVSPLVFDGPDYVARVSFGPEAALPEGTMLLISEYGVGSNDYPVYKGYLFDKLRENGVAEENLEEAVAALRLFGVVFKDKDGVRILPASAVDVEFEYKNAAQVVTDETLHAVTFRTDDGQPTKATLVSGNGNGRAAVESPYGFIQKLYVQAWQAQDYHTNPVIGQVMLRTIEKPEEATEDVVDLITTEDTEEQEEIVGVGADSKPVQAEDGSFCLYLTYGPEAGIPEDAKFVAIPVTEDHPDYAAYKERTLGAVEDQPETKPVLLGLFDLTIYDANDNVINPKAPITIRADLGNAMDEVEDVYAVHFVDSSIVAEEETATAAGAELEVLTVDSTDGAATFEADGLSVIGIVGTETVETQIRTASGDTLRVTVEVSDKNDIARFEGLRITELDSTSEAYQRAYDAVVEDKESKDADFNEENLGFYAVDITLLDMDGNEFEPEGSVNVKMEVVNLPADATTLNSSMEVHHINENSGVPVAETVAQSENVEITDGIAATAFSVESFSTFAITWSNGSSSEASENDSITKLNLQTADDLTVQINVHYIDSNGKRIKRPTGVLAIENGNAEYTITTENLAKAIDGAELQGIKYGNFSGDDVTKLLVTGAEGGTTTENKLDEVGIAKDNGEPEGFAPGQPDPRNNYYDAKGNRIFYRKPDKKYRFFTTESGKDKDNRYTGKVFVYQNVTSTAYNYTLTALYNEAEDLTKRAGDQQVDYKQTTITSDTWENAAEIYIIYGENDSNRSTVHYGYMDGSTFVEFNQDELPAAPVEINSSGDSHYAYLIYDFDGYHYADETYYHTSATTEPRTGGTQTQPLLRWSGSGQKWTYTSSGDLHTYHEYNNQSDVANGSHLYVIYEKDPAIAQGGTPKVRPVNPEEEPEAPTLTKNSLNNDDGTNTISLGITGKTTQMEVEKLADVIVVFDVSTSMKRNLDGSGENGSGAYDIGGSNRIAVAGRAVESLAQSLLEKKNSRGEPLVRMALVPFSMTAGIHSFNGETFTSDIDKFKSAVEGLQLSTGTNWEDALMKANQLAVDSERATFVIFVTDGEPSMRVSRGSYTDAQIASEAGNAAQYLARTTFYGGLSSDNAKNYDLAVPAATAIVGANKNLYTIGISSDVSTLTQLTEDCGAGADHSKTATDEAALVQAFNDIEASIIALLGAGDVQITDGITSLTNLEAKVLETVDPDSFKYYRYGGWKTTTVGGEEVKTKDKYGADYAHKTEWTTRETDGCAEATYDKATGSVQWNMGRNFQLEEDVTYVVEFRVWPSQGAYDLVADLNNGVKEYRVKTNESDSKGITQEEYAQIVEISAPVFDEEGHCTTPGNYTLKTNTDDGLEAKYKLCTKTGATVAYEDHVETKNVTIGEVNLENMDLTSQLLTIKKIFDESLDPRDVKSVILKLQRKVNDDDHTMADYNVPGTESPNIVLNNDNEWETSFYVAPGFIVDDEILEKGYVFTVTEPTIGEGGEHNVRYDLIPEIVNPMVVNSELQLIGDGDGDQALTAINRTRSAVEIHKTLYDVNGTTEIYPDTEFTITGKLLDPDGNAYTNQVPADPAAYYLYDKDGNAKTSERQHFPDSSNISFTLKAGEFIRFVNVPEGCTFQFQEDSMPENYEFKSLAAVGRQRNPETDPPYTYSIILSDTEAHLVEGETTISTTAEGIKGNTNYKLDFYNKRTIPLPDVELVKVDQDDSTKKLNGASFELHKDSADGPLVTVDGNGNAINITTGNKEGSTGPDGWYHIGLLPAGTYYMVEKAQPVGYVLDQTPIIITVTKVGNSYNVTATKGGTSVITGPEDGLYTIAVSNKKSTKYIRVFKYETGTAIALEGAKFSLTGPEGTGISYTEKTTNADGYLVFDTEGKTIIELPGANDPYTLNETEAPAGYNKIAEDINFTVNTDGVSGIGSAYEVVEESATLDGKEITVYTIKVANSAGVELPMTGGSGTLPYTLGGIGLIMASALMYIFRMRRRERRLKNSL